MGEESWHNLSFSSGKQPGCVVSTDYRGESSCPPELVESFMVNKSYTKSDLVFEARTVSNQINIFLDTGWFSKVRWQNSLKNTP